MASARSACGSERVMIETFERVVVTACKCDHHVCHNDSPANEGGGLLSSSMARAAIRTAPLHDVVPSA